MANVNLSPATGGPSTAELIGRVARGLYLVGDKSYSIDQERYNFQFTGQRAYLIVNRRLAGQVRDFDSGRPYTGTAGRVERAGRPSAGAELAHGAVAATAALLRSHARGRLSLVGASQV